MPNDDTEQEREELKNALFLELLDKRLHLAPIENPQRIIDLGTGTGTWAMDSKYKLLPHALSVYLPGEVASKYPAAHIIGVDLSPIQHPWTPPNVEWIVDDIEDTRWLLGDNFDFMHIRSVVSFLHNPQQVIQTCLQYVELYTQ